MQFKVCFVHQMFLKSKCTREVLPPILITQLKNRESNLIFPSALLCSKQTLTSAAENNISKEIWDFM